MDKDKSVYMTYAMFLQSMCQTQSGVNWTLSTDLNLSYLVVTKGFISDVSTCPMPSQSGVILGTDEFCEKLRFFETDSLGRKGSPVSLNCLWPLLSRVT